MTPEVPPPLDSWKPAAFQSRNAFCFLHVGQLISEQGVEFSMLGFTLFSNSQIFPVLFLCIHLEKSQLAVKQLNPDPCFSFNGLHFYLCFYSQCKRAGETLFPLKTCGGVSLSLNPAGPRSSTSETGLFGAGMLLYEKRVTQAPGCFTCRSLLLWSRDMESLISCVTACRCRSPHGVNTGKGEWTNPAINI